MKKLLTLMALLIAMVFTGCNLEGSDSSTNDETTVSTCPSNTTTVVPGFRSSSDGYSSSRSSTPSTTRTGSSWNSSGSSRSSSPSYSSGGSSRSSSSSSSSSGFSSGSRSSGYSSSGSSFGKSYSTPPSNSSFGKSWKFANPSFGSGY